MSGYKGQQKFEELVGSDFGEVFAVIQTSDTFQDGWKELTGMPQEGNHNPNYKDCVAYLDAVFYRGLHVRHECPLLPVETRVKSRRGSVSQSDYWHLMWELCEVYSQLVDEGVEKPKQLVNLMYDAGLIAPHDNDYDALGDI
jgi:hypothetical protein